MILDFREIPEAHKGSGVQDTFELLAREFLHFLDFQIVEEPARGADGKRDLIVQESRKGVVGKTEFRWLVSCKHKAHSGRSINEDDEPNILDRVRSHGCHGFLGFLLDHSI